MDFQSLLLFTSLLLSLSFLYWISYKRHHEHQPSLKPYPVLGVLPQFLKNRHRLFDWLADVLAAAPTNTVTFTRFGNIRGVITSNPANVEYILKTNFDNFPKGPRLNSLLHDFLGGGIFNSDGPQWRIQRKTASFEFNTRSLRNYVVRNVQEETSARLVPLLKASAATGEAIDLQDVLERYAFDNICKVAFGEDPACLADDSAAPAAATSKKLPSSFADAFRDAANLSAERFRYALPGFWKIKKLLGIGSELRLTESIAIVHDFAMQIIRSRVKERQLASLAQAADADLLSRFIANEEFSEEFLRDIVISFILAGRETTSSALTWFFWLLSSRPDVERMILEEIASVRNQAKVVNNGIGSSDEGDNRTTFEFEELREMQYLHAAITEAMRLYPPVPANSTSCQRDDVLPDGTEVKKGWFVSYQSYAMGRMESIWGTDCREYKPERWLDAGGVFRPESPFKFPAFHGGPRICLGKEMAYIQMKSIAACILERFVVQVVDSSKIPQQMMSLTLRMKGGLPVRMMERCVDIKKA
ncbi:cytochrome P450 94A1-like [Iris pallida]|uniref:noroxomaritidine synthase n=1 Tax=Iris pallida TaxID=29817 RepID=A0AAX6HCX2_IRIPA|nr:cytochrome P450 94A1-like [Iris pallida]